MGTTISFIDGLLQRVPDLKAVYDEHLSDNETLLPHVFMGDVTRFAIARAGRVRDREALETLLDCLEEGLRLGSEATKELIIVSFVENLIGEQTALQALKPKMGPALRAEVDRICG
jgi:hypothetical protein